MLVHLYILMASHHLMSPWEVISGPIHNHQRDLNLTNQILDEILKFQEVARLLLEHGADPNKRYFFGAEINLVSDPEYLELLLTFGANPDSRDRAGLTPLMKAARQRKVCCIADNWRSYFEFWKLDLLTDLLHDWLVYCWIFHFHTSSLHQMHQSKAKSSKLHCVCWYPFSTHGSVCHHRFYWGQPFVTSACYFCDILSSIVKEIPAVGDQYSIL